MSFYMPGVSDMEERMEEEKKKREDALYDIANYYNNLSDDEKEGLKLLISEKGEEYKRNRLLKERDRLNKELGIVPDPPERLTVAKGPDDYTMLNKLYEHVCKEFDRVAKALLGEDYYNTAMDQYSCASMTANDIIRKYGKKRGR